MFAILPIEPILALFDDGGGGRGANSFLRIAKIGKIYRLVKITRLLRLIKIKQKKEGMM